MAARKAFSKPAAPNKLNPESEDILHDLVQDVQSTGLVLFIGSGINGEALPQWDSLLGTLLSESLLWVEHEDIQIQNQHENLVKWCKQNLDVCAQASITKKLLGPERYRLEIQETLYGKTENIEEEIQAYCNGPAFQSKKYSFLRQVAELCSSSHVKAVATFNFDTLLECAISAIGDRRPRSYYGEVDSAKNSIKRLNDIPIYHVHGRLPIPSLFRNPDESVVLSYDEYFDKNADPLSWETATSIHLLRNYCTLWLGASLKDWNMLRLLHGALSGRTIIRSYCVQCLEDIKKPDDPKLNRNEIQNFRKTAMRIQASLLEAVGVRLILAGPAYSDIPMVIEKYVSNPLINIDDKGGK